MKGTTEIRLLTKHRCFALAALLVSGVSCVKSRTAADFMMEPDWNDIKNSVLTQTISKRQFLRNGPFRYKKFLNFSISLSPHQTVKTDFFHTRHSKKTPLVVILHGNGYSKLAHRKQGERLASWGINTLLLDLPNRNQWVKNGKILRKLTRMIYAWPSLLGKNIDRKNIIVVGHSFGGSASVIATASQSPAKGVILLDPAVVNDNLYKHMKKLRKPVIILGADKKVFRSKKRWQFFKYIPGPVAEFSITGATHTDAQFPGINKVRWGFDWESDEKRQKEFLSFLIAGVFSITVTGRLEFAWNLYSKAAKEGVVKKGRIRFVPGGDSPRIGYKNLLRTGVR